MIFGKRQLALCALTCALGLAIYLNWQAAGGTFSTGSDVQTGTSSTGESGEKFGDVELVSATGDASGYFSQVRVERQQSRDEAIETVKNIFSSSSSLSSKELEDATTAASKITEAVEKETKIESMIKAKGFEECVVFLDNGKANIVVKSEGLLPSEAAQIKDIILGAVDIKAENIRIVEVK